MSFRGLGSTDGEYELAAEVTRFAHPVCGGCVRQGIEFNRGRTHPAGSHEVDDALEMRPVAFHVGPQRTHVVPGGLGACAPDALKAARPPGLARISHTM